MKIRHWVILIVALVILPGCTAPGEAQSPGESPGLGTSADPPPSDTAPPDAQTLPTNSPHPYWHTFRVTASPQGDVTAFLVRDLGVTPLDYIHVLTNLDERTKSLLETYTLLVFDLSGESADVASLVTVSKANLTEGGDSTAPSTVIEPDWEHVWHPGLDIYDSSSNVTLGVAILATSTEQLDLEVHVSFANVQGDARTKHVQARAVGEVAYPRPVGNATGYSLAFFYNGQIVSGRTGDCQSDTGTDIGILWRGDVTFETGPAVAGPAGECGVRHQITMKDDRPGWTFAYLPLSITTGHAQWHVQAQGAEHEVSLVAAEYGATTTPDFPPGIYHGTLLLSKQGQSGYTMDFAEQWPGHRTSPLGAKRIITTDAPLEQWFGLPLAECWGIANLQQLESGPFCHSPRRGY